MCLKQMTVRVTMTVHLQPEILPAGRLIDLDPSHGIHMDPWNHHWNLSHRDPLVSMLS
jgi:hypothetical protein